MDKHKSKKKLSPYRSYMKVREGLNFSDYFSDEVPYDVKPVPSVTPMEESDYPTQSKDLFKGLWEDKLRLTGYWLDPEGHFHRIMISHAEWATLYLKAKGEEPDENIDKNIYTLYDLGFVSVRVKQEVIYFNHNPQFKPNDIQIEILKQSAKSSNKRLVDDSFTREVEVEVELEREPTQLSENNNGRQLFIESMMPDDIDTFKSHLAQLFVYLQKELQLKTIPNVRLISDEKNANKVLGKTAYYEPDTRTVVLYTTNRHQKDVLRSFAHEVVHHWQHENEKFQTSSTGGEKKRGESHPTTDPRYAQKNPWLRQMEKQAYLLGNIIFRDWSDKKVESDRKSAKKNI